LSVEEDGVWLPDLGKELPVKGQLPHACCVVPVAEIMKTRGSREDKVNVVINRSNGKFTDK
jgi:hypothetical protein